MSETTSNLNSLVTFILHTLKIIQYYIILLVGRLLVGIYLNKFNVIEPH